MDLFPVNACGAAEACICKDGECVDTVAVTFGYRSFHVDPNTGFWLNGRNVPLHGVSRHQDRLDKGWARSKADHEQDIALIREIGANTIRLVHYQHHQYFYDLCDKTGFVLWAEIRERSVTDTILMTGATGFWGSELATRLIRISQGKIYALV